MKKYHQIMAGINLGCVFANIAFAFIFIQHWFSAFHLLAGIVCYLAYSFHKSQESKYE